MREILFRGKRIDNGNWEEGTPFQEYNDFWGEWLWFIQTKHPLTNAPFLHLEIDRKSISQFTGLTDKNGKKIFEGDIIKWDAAEWGEEYCEPVVWDYSFLAVRQDDWQHFCEVIGNIHDNPELLRRDGNG